jgi:hypothetical protein
LVLFAIAECHQLFVNIVTNNWWAAQKKTLTYNGVVNAQGDPNFMPNRYQRGNPFLPGISASNGSGKIIIYLFFSASAKGWNLYYAFVERQQGLRLNACFPTRHLNPSNLPPK